MSYVRVFCTLPLYAAALVLLAACNDNSSIANDKGESGLVKISFDWNGYRYIPPGMNIVFYPSDNTCITEGYDVASPISCQIQYDGATTALPFGTYNVVLYNDYTNTFVYRNMEKFATASAFLPDYNRQPLARRDSLHRNVTQPDILYTAHEKTSISDRSPNTSLHIRPQLATRNVSIHVDICNVGNVAMADGALCGVGGDFMLADGRASNDTCRILFPFRISNNGLDADIRIIPCHNPANMQYTIELAFLLANNSVSIGKYKYDVSTQLTTALANNTNNDTIRVNIDSITVDNVYSSGLDASVDEWGNQIDIDIK